MVWTLTHYITISAKKMYHMDFHVPSKLHTWAEEQWETIDNHTSLNRGEVEKPLRVGLVLGTSWATKEWPQEKWYPLLNHCNIELILFA